MKQIQIIIPDSVLADVDEVLKDTQVGGITHYRVERRGITKADACCWEGTMKYTPYNLPWTQEENRGESVI